MPANSGGLMKEDELRDWRKKRLIPLRGLRALSVSTAPMASLLPPDSLRPQPNKADFKGVEGKLEKILRQRMESVEGAWSIIHSRLSDVGIQVLSNEKLMNRPGQAYLGVMIDLGKPKKKATCSVQLSMTEEVMLARDPEIRFAVETWRSGVVTRKYPKEGKLVTEEDRKLGRLEDAVDEVMRWFLDDYRVANDLD
jgi:hypothetical protein